MGMFDKIGRDAKAAQAMKDKIKVLEAKLYTASADEYEEIKAEISKLKMLLAASNNN